MHSLPSSRDLIRDLDDTYMSSDLRELLCDELGDDVTLNDLQQSHYRVLLDRVHCDRSIVTNVYEAALQRWRLN